RWIAMPLAALAEGVWWGLSLKGEPPITRFTVQQISSSHWYDLSNARDDFKYQPLVSGDDGKERTIAWLRDTVAAQTPPPPAPEPPPTEMDNSGQSA
ncbi:MAG: hypothetical protein AAF211_23785, partial [Myxococcota bacterium]